MDGSTPKYVAQGHPQEQESGLYCLTPSSLENVTSLVKYMINCSEQCNFIVLFFLTLKK